MASVVRVQFGSNFRCLRGTVLGRMVDAVAVLFVEASLSRYLQNKDGKSRCNKHARPATELGSWLDDNDGREFHVDVCMTKLPYAEP